LDLALRTLEQAKQTSSDRMGYAEAEAMITGMKRDIDVTIAVVASAKPGTEPVVFGMLANQNIRTAQRYGQAAIVLEKTWGRLGQVLQERLARARQHLLVYAGTAAMCALIGVGTALWMFRSTLRRLDLVELEKVRADTARAEAEKSRAETESVNEQVAGLNRSLAENIQKLKEAQDEIVKKGRMEQMGQLTATIAHELRNPLGAVRTSTFLLAKKVSGRGLNVESQIERINNGVSRCDNIISQLLDYSRNKPLQCQSSNLDDWLSKVVSEESARLPQAVMIELALGLDDAKIPFDPARLQRAIINLMSNASEAMLNGGSGNDPTANPRIWITTRFSREGDAVIQVRDNGPGIAPENLAKVREPLFTTKSFGTGLGIPAIEQIANQHGGRLEIESCPGDGASFEIHLPVTPREAAA
jgi:signal transduction histidine kinase